MSKKKNPKRLQPAPAPLQPVVDYKIEGDTGSTIPLYRYDLELLRKALQRLLPYEQPPVPLPTELQTPSGENRRMHLIVWLTQQINMMDSKNYKQIMLDLRARYWKEKQDYGD